MRHKKDDMDLFAEETDILPSNPICQIGQKIVSFCMSALK